MRIYNETIEHLETTLNTNRETGLTPEQVRVSRQSHGSNALAQDKPVPLWKKILHHGLEVMNIILLLAAGLSTYISIREPTHGWVEPIVIVLIFLINIIVSMIQEGKADNALASLKSLSSPTSQVTRDGVVMTIDSHDLVVGDLLMIHSGDRIAADARLVRSNGLRVDESALTGESIAVDKDEKADVAEQAALGDQLTMIFSGTHVVAGNGVALVSAVGSHSQMGKVSELLKTTVKEKTPLQKRIDQLARQLALLAFAAGAIIFVVNAWLSDVPFFANLMSAVTLGIAAVPETLPVIVTLTLATGVENMAHRHAIIRHIPAVETLGSASIIASDKTGTLTQNHMSIQRLWHIDHEPHSVTAENWSKDEELLIEWFAQASNATATKQEDGSWQVSGEPTEVAILDVLKQRADDVSQVSAGRVLEIPFDSTRKKMTVVYPEGTGYRVLTKGAFDRLVDSLEGKTKRQETKAWQVHDDFAGAALRVLALSTKWVASLPAENDVDSLEDNQTFVGLVGMIDPPRPESKQAVKEARAAGIKPIMITGDHALTATAIARELDIYRQGDQAITGVELSEMSDQAFQETIESYAVYARVSPEDKIRIVQAWQHKGHVVAMTGDGVNDAPSLNAADVGIAMGITGTEVAKHTADMILTDDNFATIIRAVEEGRRVYSNIKKTVYYLLSANVAEIALMLIAALIGWGAPLSGIQLLLINVLADGVPGFGLSREKAEKGSMNQAPIGMRESLFSRGGYRRIIIAASTFTITSLLAYWLGAFVSIQGVPASPQLGQTLTFLVLGLSSTLHIFVARSGAVMRHSRMMENPTILLTGGFSALLTIVLVGVPQLGSLIGLTPLSGVHWLIGLGLALIILGVVDLEKTILKRMNKTFMA